MTMKFTIEEWAQRYGSTQPITDDDIINLRIDLQRSEDVNAFLLTPVCGNAGSGGCRLVGGDSRNEIKAKAI